MKTQRYTRLSLRRPRSLMFFRCTPAQKLDIFCMKRFVFFSSSNMFQYSFMFAAERTAFVGEAPEPGVRTFVDIDGYYTKTNDDICDETCTDGFKKQDKSSNKMYSRSQRCIFVTKHLKIRPNISKSNENESEVIITQVLTTLTKHRSEVITIQVLACLIKHRSEPQWSNKNKASL